MAPLLAALLPTLGDIAKRVIKDPAALDEFNFKMAELAQNGELAKMADASGLFKMEVEDRKSAREMAIAQGMVPQMILGGLITVGFFGVLGYLLVYGAPQSGGEVLYVMLGSLGTAWAAVCNFFFGSTSGSTKKTDLLAKAAPIK